MSQINYRTEVDSLAEEREVYPSPVSGTIESATLHFPPGTSGYVEIVINHGTRQILPTTRGGIALDNVTQTFHIGEPVTKNDVIEVVYTNHDDTNSHTLSVVVYVRELYNLKGKKT